MLPQLPQPAQQVALVFPEWAQELRLLGEAGARFRRRLMQPPQALGNQPAALGRQLLPDLKDSLRLPALLGAHLGELAGAPPQSLLLLGRELREALEALKYPLPLFRGPSVELLQVAAKALLGGGRQSLEEFVIAQDPLLLLGRQWPQPQEESLRGLLRPGGALEALEPLPAALGRQGVELRQPLLEALTSHRRQLLEERTTFERAPLLVWRQGRYAHEQLPHRTLARTRTLRLALPGLDLLPAVRRRLLPRQAGPQQRRGVSRCQRPAQRRHCQSHPLVRSQPHSVSSSSSAGSNRMSNSSSSS